MEIGSDLKSIHQAREMVEMAARAQKIIKEFSQEQIDKIVKAMAEAGEKESERLAKFAVEDTGMGRYEDKILKNKFGSKVLYDSIKDMKTVGIINQSPDGKLWEIAEPMGVIVALVPTTNPTSTAFYKAIISVKSRNGIVMAPHPRAIACTAEATRVVRDAAEKAGAPKGLIHCMTEVSIEGTNELMRQPLTNLILATGSSAMVRAAQSTGKPAYGVGSGNVPAYVDRTANVDKAIRDIVTGTSFDNGNLCSTERSVVVDAPIKEAVLAAFKKNQAAVLSPDDVKKLEKTVVPGGKLNTDTVGQSAVKIAQMAGISVSPDIKVLVAEIKSVGKKDPLSMETLSPILSLFVVNGWEEGCQRCMEILNFGGMGHSMSLHAQDQNIIREFALKKPAMRICVNTVAALGAVGFTTALPPAMTLGCGTWGGSITTNNITPMDLLNIKRVAFETQSYTANWMTGSSKSTTPKTSAPKPEPRAPKPLSKFVSYDTVTKKSASPSPGKSWMEEIDQRIRDKAGNPSVKEVSKEMPKVVPQEKVQEKSPEKQATATTTGSKGTTQKLSDQAIESLIHQYTKK